MAGLLIHRGGFSPTTGTLGSGVTFDSGITGIPAAGVSGTLGSGVAISSDVTGYTGIKCCEMYYLNTGVWNSTGFTITSNYTRHPDSIGTVISVSGGIFSFDLTGLYKIDFATYTSRNNISLWIRGDILTTVNNSAYIVRATGITHRPLSTESYSGTYTTYLFDVSDKDLCKVKFSVASEAQTGWYDGLASSNYGIGRNYWIFTRMGDT